MREPIRRDDDAWSRQSLESLPVVARVELEFFHQHLAIATNSGRVVRGLQLDSKLSHQTHESGDVHFQIRQRLRHRVLHQL